MQQQKLEKLRRDLANLDQKAKSAKAKLKQAEDDVTKAKADLEHLPPPPQGIEEQKERLQAQWRDLNMQV